MSEPFDYDVFLSHSAKDKAVVRPLAERLRQDGPMPKAEVPIHHSFFILFLPGRCWSPARSAFATR